MSNIGKKLSDQAKKAIKQAKQIAKEEVEKTFDQARTQTVGEKPKETGRSLIQEIVGGGVSEEQAQNIENEEKVSSSGRLKQLEQEMAYFKRKREQEIDQWKKDQEEKMKEGKQDSGQTLVILPSSPRKGQVGPGMAQKKGGTGEMMRQKN